jgi:hypothetical protein
MNLKAIMVATLLVMISTQAYAADQFGLGLILGEPTGLSVKYWLNDENAIDGAAAWSFSGNNSFQLHADYLWHNYDLIDATEAPGKLPVYYGVGARLRFKDDDRHHDDDIALGIRVPLGVTCLFAKAPFDVFAEIAPILDLTPDADLELSAAIGARYYFK